MSSWMGILQRYSIFIISYSFNGSKIFKDIRKAPKIINFERGNFMLQITVLPMKNSGVTEIYFSSRNLLYAVVAMKILFPKRRVLIHKI